MRNRAPAPSVGIVDPAGEDVVRKDGLKAAHGSAFRADSGSRESKSPPVASATHGRIGPDGPADSTDSYRRPAERI